MTNQLPMPNISSIATFWFTCTASLSLLMISFRQLGSIQEIKLVFLFIKYIPVKSKWKYQICLPLSPVKYVWYVAGGIKKYDKNGLPIAGKQYSLFRAKQLKIKFNLSFI